MATIVYPPGLADNYESYAPITTRERFQVTTVKASEHIAVMESVVIVDGRAVKADSKALLRYRMLKRYRIASGAVSILWLFASFAALASRSSAEPFFAL